MRNEPLAARCSAAALIRQTDGRYIMYEGGDEKRQIAAKQTRCFANGSSYDT